MAHIDKCIENHRDLTLMVVSGKVSSDELLEALADFYKSGFTQNLLWDFSKSDLTRLATDQLYTILSCSEAYSHLRPEGKTAFVTSGTFAFGLGRMYESISRLDGNPVTYGVFTSMDEALAWLER